MTNRSLNRLKNIFLLLLTALLLIPFYIAVINAFKPNDAIISNPMGFTWEQLSLNNFREVAITPTFNIFRAYFTTAVVTVASTVSLIVFASMMAYVIARSKHKFFLFAYLLLLGGMMIPPQVILIPIIKLLRTLGLMFSEVGLILYNTGWYIPFTVFIYTGFIRTISRELDESAMIEGGEQLHLVLASDLSDLEASDRFRHHFPVFVCVERFSQPAHHSRFD